MQHSSPLPTMKITSQGTNLGEVYLIKPTFKDFSSDLGKPSKRPSVITLSESMVVELGDLIIISRYLATLTATMEDRSSRNPVITTHHIAVDHVIGSDKSGTKASYSWQSSTAKPQATRLDTLQRNLRRRLMNDLMEDRLSSLQCRLSPDSDMILRFNTFESSPDPLEEILDPRIYQLLLSMREPTTLSVDISVTS